MEPVSITRNPDPEVLARALLDDLLEKLSAGDLLCIPTGRSPRDLYRLIREDSGNSELWRSCRPKAEPGVSEAQKRVAYAAWRRAQPEVVRFGVPPPLRGRNAEFV